MATRSAALRQTSKSRAAQPAARPTPEARPDLGVLDRRQVVARARRRQARALVFLAGACLAIPLVFSAVGHALVASDQVRSDALQGQIATALQTQQDYQLQKAELLAPTRILSIAETHLHMATPAAVVYLRPVNPGETVAQAHAQAGPATSLPAVGHDATGTHPVAAHSSTGARPAP
ncbi:MAG: hypothetical protein ABSD78_03710 [Acidimicrobiales bacterium]|jgi:hypothetical protein